MSGLGPRGDSAQMLLDASCTPEFVMRPGLEALGPMSCQIRKHTICGVLRLRARLYMSCH